MNDNNKTTYKDLQENIHDVENNATRINQKEEINYTGVCLTIGAELGVSFGVIFDQLAIGISLGITLGVVLGSIMEALKKKQKDKQ